MFLGMLDGAESVGFHPDLIVGTCGGSLAAALVQAFPDPVERRRFVESEEFQKFLLSPESRPAGSWAKAIGVIAGMHYREYVSDLLPDIFDKFFVQIRFESFLASASRPFLRGGPAVVMVASRVGFSPEDVARGETYRGRKLFKEVFFTDPDTADLLKGFQSPIALQFPESAVPLDTDVIHDIHLDRAARASVSDPYFVNPMKLGDQYYLTGAVDLYPIEVAHTLADSVAMSFDSGFSSFVELPAIYSTFRYNNNQRLRFVNDMYSRYWIDRSDGEKMYASSGFSPVALKGTLALGVPVGREGFLKKIREQWDWGRARAIEGLSRPTPNDKSHIRIMNLLNSSRDLRRKYGR